MNLNRIENAINRQERNKLNENWEKIEQGVSKVESKADEALEITDALLNGNFDEAALQTNIEQKLAAKEEEYAPQLTSLTAQLVDKASKSQTNAKMNKLPSAFLEKVRNKIPIPTGFNWTNPPITVYRNGLGEVSSELDFSSYIVGSTTRYVNRSTGLDTNNGLTAETAYKTISKAINEGADKIYIGSGTYYYNESFNGQPINKDISLIALDDADVIIQTSMPLTWSTVNGYPNVRQASRTQLASVYDNTLFDKNGDYRKLTLRSSLQEVQDNPGSYYYESPILYVHTHDSRAFAGTNTSIVPFLNVSNLRVTGDFHVYLKGIKLYGGNVGAGYFSASSVGETPIIVAENCEFKYSNAGNGGFVTLGADSILKNCIASSNFNDGFNYHKLNGIIPKAIEVDCIAYNNGLPTDYTDNGSTMHDGGKVIRVNGKYYENYGPNIAEIDTGTQSWNIGCEAYKSLTSIVANNTNYYVDNCEMWLDGCIGYDSNKSYRSINNATLRLSNSLFDDGIKDVTANISEY